MSYRQIITIRRARVKILSILITTLLLLSACSSQYGRYQQANDSKPVRLPTTGELNDAVPRDEPHSRGGNRHYQVRGKNYQVLSTAERFEQTGIASWYGKKFHGHLTSNGEIYDMYAMSAAHKNLPLPTYAKITNLSNNKSVIVRVNDRGPFHQDRVIDLSYSAAYKLDMLKTGTANVRITAITDFTPKNVKPVTLSTTKVKKVNKALVPKKKTNKNSYFIQIIATRDQRQAQDTASALATLYQQEVNLPEQNGIYRVQMGPFERVDRLNNILTSLQRNGYSGAYRRKLLQ